MTDAAFDVAEAIALLRRTPAVLRALLADLPPAWLACDEGPDTFTPRDVIGHLVHGERTDWIPRAAIILAQGANRRFEPFDRFGHVRESAGRSIEQLLDELAALREKNVATLDGWRLGPRELSLQGEHPALGRVTLAQLLAAWAVHDLTHVNQVARTMAKRYDADVGPWKAYLSILTR
ncbi:MAG TPA: DinB family protein [Longimicrobiales bacterium]